MNLKSSQFNLTSLRPWLTILAIVWLLGSVGLSWLVNSLLIIFAIMLLVPIIGFIGFRWWLQRNLVTDNCPVCAYELAGLNKTQVQCPNCGEQLLVEQGNFQRITPEGTIDITAVEINARSDES
ncbi:MAG: hypothetical protein AAF378_21975 [Cyanobacteria bacterium P01_A01_bin.84]